MICPVCVAHDLSDSVARFLGVEDAPVGGPSGVRMVDCTHVPRMTIAVYLRWVVTISAHGTPLRDAAASQSHFLCAHIHCSGASRI